MIVINVGIVSMSSGFQPFDTCRPAKNGEMLGTGKIQNRNITLCLDLDVYFKHSLLIYIYRYNSNYANKIILRTMDWQLKTTEHENNERDTCIYS